MKEGNNFGKLTPFIMKEKGTRAHSIAVTDKRIKYLAETSKGKNRYLT